MAASRAHRIQHEQAYKGIQTTSCTGWIVSTCFDLILDAPLPLQVMCCDYGFRSGAARMYQAKYGQIPKNAWHLVGVLQTGSDAG